MLPVVDREGTRSFRQIILYATALVGVSLLPAVLGLAGVVYFFGALVVCTALVQVCLWAASNKTNVRAKWLMHARSEEHTSELQSRLHLVCRLLLEKKKQP